MQLAEIDAQMDALGAAPTHRARVLRHWLQAIPLDQGRRPLADFLPRRLFEALPALLAQWEALAVLHTRESASDGAERLLLRLHDGQSVEAVLLPPRRKSLGLCISSQVGCAVGCGFCMTGTLGLLRQLGSAELVAQVAAARRLRAVNKLVFMGMGEPSHNLDAVCAAIECLGQEGGLAHKQIVFSTVGDARVTPRLRALRVRPALALSLHSLDDALRAELLPRAPRLPAAELLHDAIAYARDTGYPLQLQWTLLAGVNDSEAALAPLLALLRGQPAMLNLIPFNTVPGLPFERPARERCLALVAAARASGVLATLRDSAGQDVEGGCGQLRARLQPVRVLRPARAAL